MMGFSTEMVIRLQLWWNSVQNWRYGSSYNGIQYGNGDTTLIMIRFSTKMRKRFQLWWSRFSKKIRMRCSILMGFDTKTVAEDSYSFYMIQHGKLRYGLRYNIILVWKKRILFEILWELYTVCMNTGIIYGLKYQYVSITNKCLGIQTNEYSYDSEFSWNWAKWVAMFIIIS